jgi:adenylate cyclase
MFELLQIANTLDPNFAPSIALAAQCLASRKAFGWSADVARDIVEMRQLARRAVDLDRNDPTVLLRAGFTIAHTGDLEEAAALLARSISLNPNSAWARIWMGWVRNWLGDADAAIEPFNFALRLNPLDPLNLTAYNGISMAHFLSGRYEEGVSWAKRSLQQNPHHHMAYRLLGLNHAMSGRVQEARAAYALELQFGTRLRISELSKTFPFRRPADLAKLEEAYRIMGVSE